MIASALTVVLTLGPHASAQEPTLPEAVRPVNDLHEEMFALIREIERKLGRIDVELADASAGEAPLEAVGDSGIEKLLRSSREKMEEVVESIDRVFEIRDHHQGGGT